MRALFRTFEEKSRLVRILNACISGDGIRVLIGHENPDPELRDLSLVTASCRVEGERAASAWASSARRAWSTRTSSRSWTTWPGRCPTSCGGIAREHEGQRATTRTSRSPRAAAAGRRRTRRRRRRRPAERGRARRAAAARRRARGAAPRARRAARTRSCAGGPSSRTTAGASSATAARRRPRPRPASCGSSSAPSTTSSARSRAGGARVGAARGRRADPARAAGACSTRWASTALDPLGRAVRPGRATRRSCTSRRRASRRGRWRRSSGRATRTRTGCSGPRSSRWRAARRAGRPRTAAADVQ